MEKIGENANFYAEINTYTILRKTGVRVYMGFFTFRNISFLLFFSIVTLVD